MLPLEYKKRIVSYFDILGFGAAVEGKAIDATSLDALFAAIDGIVSDYNSDNMRIDYFSDSFVITIQTLSLSAKQLRLIIDVLAKLLEYKFVARGAMIYGEVMHKERNIYGPALVKAARLETHKAVFPRIILDESLNDLTIPTIGGFPITHTGFFKDFMYVSQDLDHFHYVDYIKHFRDNKKFALAWENLQHLTAQGVTFTDENLRKKYLWLDAKINETQLDLSFYSDN